MNTDTTRPAAIGDQLTDYTSVDVEVRRIASGGFGVVYLGPNRLDGGRWVALKTLRPDVLARSPRAYDLFVREGLTWVGLWPHPNLVTALAVTTINGQPFLVLTYAEHGSLRDQFTDHRQHGTWFPATEALRLTQHIAAGLVALHTPDPVFLRPFPIVHRDLKPENVLIEEQGYAQITDFGLAKVVERAGQENPALLAFLPVGVPAGVSDRLATNQRYRDTRGDTDTVVDVTQATRSQRYQTARGIGMGTMAYMAPEQWEDAAAAGPPADVYAFGILLCEVVTGHHPLLDLAMPHSQADWRQAHQLGQPRPLRLLGGPMVHGRAAAAQGGGRRQMAWRCWTLRLKWRWCIRRVWPSRPRRAQLPQRY